MRTCGYIGVAVADARRENTKERQDMVRQIGIGACAAVLAVAGAAAHAESISLSVYENADGGDTSGLDLTVTLAEALGGNAIDFIFTNDSTSGFVGSIYIESTASTAGLSNGRIEAESAGVDFSDGATPPNPATIPANFGGAWGGNLYSVDANPPGPQNGINAGVGESLTIRFDLVGVSVQDIIDSATSEPRGFRIAQHVQGLPFSVWTTSVPTPGAAMTGLAAFGLMASRRRR